jgi:tRNA U38,U39,U40 pseudouridine synthase TruA
LAHYEQKTKMTRQSTTTVTATKATAYRTSNDNDNDNEQTGKIEQQQEDDTNSINTNTMTNKFYYMYKLIVEYDGTRFHGFQRQIDNKTFQQKWGNSTTDCKSINKNNNCNYLYSKLVPKRPHYENGIGWNSSGKHKGCESISIQECIELAVLDLLCTNVNNSNSHIKDNTNTNTNSNDNNQQQREQDETNVTLLTLTKKQQRKRRKLEKQQLQQNQDKNQNQKQQMSKLTILDDNKHNFIDDRIYNNRKNNSQTILIETDDRIDNNNDVNTCKPPPHVPICQTIPFWTVDDLCLRFAGRTDKGVHATGQVVTVYLPSLDDISTLLLLNNQSMVQLQSSLSSSVTTTSTTTTSCWNNKSFWKLQLLRKAWNSRLPNDISIQQIFLLDSERTTSISSPSSSTPPSLPNTTTTKYFDPRRDAKTKRYSYTIQYLRKPHQYRQRHKEQKTCTTNSSTINGNVNTDKHQLVSEAVTPINESNDNHFVVAGAADDTNGKNHDLLQAMYGISGPHLIRHAMHGSTGSNLWICPWMIDDTHLQLYCTQLQGQHDYYNFIHHDERIKSNKHQKVKTTIPNDRKNDSLDNVVDDDDDDDNNNSNGGGEDSYNTCLTIDSITYTILNEERHDSCDRTIMTNTSSSSIVSLCTNNQLIGNDDEEGSINHDDNNNNNNDVISTDDDSCFVVVTGRFVLQAIGFRRTLVRNIVGYCIDLCRHSIHAQQLQQQQLNGNPTTTTTTPTSNVDKDDKHNNSYSNSTSWYDTNSNNNNISDLVWIPNEQFASSKIHAAPACGLCLESVLY